MKKLTVDEAIAWWQAASTDERKQLIDALVKKVGVDELYLMMVEEAGSEEELARIVEESQWRCRLS